MQLTLERRWTDKLSRLPESGMGYQRVRVRLKAGRTIEHVMVLNASILEIPETVQPFGAQDIEEIELDPHPGSVPQ